MADCKIWVVDDDLDDLYLVEQAFKECFYEIRTFSGELIPKVPDVLIQSSEESLPQLLLLDINMPLVSGKDILGRIRTHPSLRHLPVAMFTTSNSRSERNQCLELGANCFITKPSDFTAMVQICSALSTVFCSPQFKTRNNYLHTPRS